MVNEKLNTALAELSTREGGTEALKEIATTIKNSNGSINANQLKETAAPNMNNIEPTITSAISNAKKATDLTNAQIAGYTQSQAELSQELKNSGVQGTGYKALIDLNNAQPKIDLSAERARANDEYNISQLSTEVRNQVAKVNSLNAQINGLEIERAAEKESVNNRLASRGAIDNEIRAIDRKYNIKKSKLSSELLVEAALAQTYQGNLTEAQNLVNQAIDDYKVEFQYEKERFDNMFDIYSTWIGDLSTEEKRVLEQARLDLEKEETKEDERLKTIGNLMLKYNGYGAGITLNDTLETAMAKAGISSKELANLDIQAKKLDVALKNKQLNEVGGGSEDVLTSIQNFAIEALAMSDTEKINLDEAVSKLPIPLDQKASVYNYALMYQNMAQEEERNNLNRINTEPVTKELVTELLNSGYNMDQIKAVAQDDATLKQITMAYSEAAFEGMQKSAESFGRGVGETLGGVGDILGYYNIISPVGNANLYGQMIGGALDVISPFLKGAEEGLNK